MRYLLLILMLLTGSNAFAEISKSESELESWKTEIFLGRQDVEFIGPGSIHLDFGSPVFSGGTAIAHTGAGVYARYKAYVNKTTNYGKNSGGRNTITLGFKKRWGTESGALEMKSEYTLLHSDLTKEDSLFFDDDFHIAYMKVAAVAGSSSPRFSAGIYAFPGIDTSHYTTGREGNLYLGGGMFIESFHIRLDISYSKKYALHLGSAEKLSPQDQGGTLRIMVRAKPIFHSIHLIPEINYLRESGAQNIYLGITISK